MTNRPRWTTVDPNSDGIWTLELSSWKHFHAFIHQEMLAYRDFVWRGQRDSGWKLRSSLDRALQGTPRETRSEQMARHLERFRYASRGRRAALATPIEEENDWWALGQHNGLATPLLDWTESPFVALYFAFEKEERSSTAFRSVWALADMSDMNEEIRNAHDGPNPPTLDYVRPFRDDNTRLVNQAALFTRVPFGMTVAEWVTAQFKGDSETAGLIHLKIPDKDRFDCLRTLNRMNINHTTLFPDLYGAAEHCNKALRIGAY